MQATRGKTGRVSQDIEQQNLTVAAKKRTGLSADIAEVGAHPRFVLHEGQVGDTKAQNIASLPCSGYQ